MAIPAAPDPGDGRKPDADASTLAGLLERAPGLAREALADKARGTPGPWKTCGAQPDAKCPCGLIWSISADMTVVSTSREGENTREMGDCGTPADLMFIATARTREPLLAEAVIALTAEVARTDLMLDDAMGERDIRVRQIEQIADVLGDESEWTNLNDRGDAAYEAAEYVLGQVAAVTVERDAYRAMICDLLASASPHPTEHPTMTTQWNRARALLKDGPTDAAKESDHG